MYISWKETRKEICVEIAVICLKHKLTQQIQLKKIPENRVERAVGLSKIFPATWMIATFWPLINRTKAVRAADWYSPFDTVDCTWQKPIFFFLSTISWNSWMRDTLVTLTSPLKLNRKMPDFFTVKVPVSRLKSPYWVFVSNSNDAKESEWPVDSASAFVHVSTENTGTAAVLFESVSVWTLAFKSIIER